jgi:glycosyltransferase involved in cell wall biosynthesis
MTPARTKPGVLMVTGAYFPERSGAGLQCRALVRQLCAEVDFTVLTTTTTRASAGEDGEDGVPIYRVFIDPASWRSKLAGSIRFIRIFARIRRRFTIVHFHGFSQKSILLVWLARAARKQIAVKLTSVGHDDPLSIRRRDGALAYRAFVQAAMFFAPSPRFLESYAAAGLPGDRCRLIPNGVDLVRFRPAATGEREALRRVLEVPGSGPVFLFVGFFSQEKRPDRLFDAWAALKRSAAPKAVLVFVGATVGPYYEVDEALAGAIRKRAAALGVADSVLFVEATDEIERFYRAADIYVLPSVREGLPNALLEAMASGVACIATRLPGVTDAMIDDGRDGLLVPPDDAAQLESALVRVAGDPGFAARLGEAARQTAVARYGLDTVAARYLTAYRDLMSTAVCVA